MKLNFVKKYFGKAKESSETKNSNIAKEVSQPKNNDVAEELKTILHDKWEEQKKFAVPFEELYAQMVEEAVLTIKNSWKTRANYRDNFKLPVNELSIKAYNTFFITKDLALYSDSMYKPRNPKTSHYCFYANFTFPNADLVDKYITDILALLPERTIVEKEDTVSEFGNITTYSFIIQLTDLQEK